MIDAITDRVEALSVKQRAKWCKVHRVREGNGEIVAMLKRCSDVELRTALERLG